MGKRSGEGFVAHKAKLVNALSRALAARLELMDLTVGRKGFLGYIRALSGSNVVKIVPATNGNASGSQVAVKRLKIVCGAHTSYLDDLAWVGKKTPLSFAEVRVSPDNTIKPNIGSLELAEAINRVLPFTSKDNSRPVLQSVLFRAKEGKLKLIASDGFRLAEVTLDYEDNEGEALVHRDELKGIANALRKAKRARLSFEPSTETLNGMNLAIDTEIICYKWQGQSGDFPKYEQIIPQDFSTLAHIDSIEAIKAIKSLKAVSDNPKDYPIDLTIGEGVVTMASPDGKGESIVKADTDGQVNAVRLDGKYLAEALKACGGMVDVKLTTIATAPVLFASDGCQVLVMPMMTDKSKEATQKVKQPQEQVRAEAEAQAEAVAKTEAPAEAEVIAKAEEIVTKAKKAQRRRKREPVAVA